MGTWTNTGAVLPVNLSYSQAKAVFNAIYLFGGLTPGGYTNAIYSASIFNPLLWTNTGATLPVPSGFGASQLV